MELNQFVLSATTFRLYSNVPTAFPLSSNNKKTNATKLPCKPLHQIKKLIKCVMRTGNKNNNNNNKSILTAGHKQQVQQQHQHHHCHDQEIADNNANEILENEIFEEIDTCEDHSGVTVYHGDSREIVPIARGQRYIPVHFARTECGTFFWTSTQSSSSSSSSTTVIDDICNYGDQNPICNYQVAEVQVPCSTDRWAQA